MKQQKSGSLHDAARMLRTASRRIDEYAVSADACSYEQAGSAPFTNMQRRRISEAVAAINAALARIAPYQED